MWENWIIAERLKFNNLRGGRLTPWFWRTKQQAEIDYLEDADGVMKAYEFKWNPKARASLPQSFQNSYPGTEYNVVTPANYDSFIS